MKALYFDCFAGASGDMILGALVALGVDENELVAEISKLNISDFKVTFEKVDRSGISAIKARVEVPPEHAHRHLPAIEKIINESELNEKVKIRAIAIFTNLATAEAKVHGISIEKVHFHEVGAMDAIIDVVGACIGFEILGIDKFACSKIHVGSGFVKMAHGKFPVPPPAVTEILQSKNIPIYQTEMTGELLTPTGAAIIATICDDFGAIPEIEITKSAYGAGGREYKDFPNVLRLILGKSFNAKTQSRKDAKGDGQGIMRELTDHPSPTTDHLVLIETNLDDITAQTLGFVMERSFACGALDCWFTPIQMKKNRPATMISILCSQEKREILTELLYTETTTLGVRVREVERECLAREVIKTKTEFGEIDVKIARYGEKIVNAKAEYEQLREVALKSNLSLREVESIVLEEFKKEQRGK